MTPAQFIELILQRWSEHLVAGMFAFLLLAGVAARFLTECVIAIIKAVRRG